GERKPIMGGPDRGIRHRRIITVYKIEIGILIDIVEQRMIRKRYAIPTHMRYLHSLSFRKSYHRNIKYAQTVDVTLFRMPTHQLKPQTNPQKRPVKGPYHFVQVMPPQIIHRRTGLPYPWKYNFFRPTENFRIARQNRSDIEPFQREQNRLDISRVVINYGDFFHRTPLVLANVKSLTSLRIADFNARANALNIDSILWCSFSPRPSICKLMRASSEKDLKKCENISVGTSPIFSR